MSEKLLHINLKRPEFDFEMQSYIAKVYAHVLDMTEEAIVNACIKAAKEAGITDLYLIDKQFLIDALIEKMRREKGDPDA